MDKKKCIFHVPNYIDLHGTSGSSIRPRKMLEAFISCGYKVDYVMGYGLERKRKIQVIKEQIRAGTQYDFVYSESSTMPTLLTEKNHIPKYPNLDFGFLKYCRKHGIKIALFYRDIQWKFSVYRDNVVWYKRLFSIPLYKYDLWKYQNLVDVFYLPTQQMASYLKDKKKLLQKMDILMPGCDKSDDIFLPIQHMSSHKPINIFYVGGVDRIYDLTVFLKTVNKMQKKVKAVICCREEDWRGAEEKYRSYLGENIVVIHASGKELKQYYMDADLCCAFAGTGEYMKMAMPVKVFEYIGNLVPILATKGTAAGDFVEKENIGWSIEYNVDTLTSCLNEIIADPQMLEEKWKNELKILNQHTWKSRAEKVIHNFK